MGFRRKTGFCSSGVTRTHSAPLAACVSNSCHANVDTLPLSLSLACFSKLFFEIIEEKREKASSCFQQHGASTKALCDDATVGGDNVPGGR